ncbi:diacylglycerol/lipid kinase family protein [Enterococcus sp. JM9B]|uniref:diacylglycerol/lipid kinase family protein n=1 Tax=Enterococcus sp. JM9B TaxID=1857216 RepID=UPI0013750AC0|nr:diacylglycerol kinase family protein [Enterococcus sp. JM9B]KAF1301314.1 diacylglycerol kinase [Enterococcus sp. JM9B]
MKNAMLIVNPSSGGEKAKEFEKLVVEKLSQLFTDVVILATEKAGDATNFARQAAIENYDSVFAIGGDGTVNEVINGLAEQKSPPKFGFFPLGTVNDLARALHISLDPKKAIDELNLSQTKKIDLGKINDQYFMNVVAIGLIPEAINHVSAEEKTRFGKLAYFISGLKQLSGNQSYPFQLCLDDEKEQIESSTVIVSLTNSVGGFEQLFPEAKVDDGLLHLIYLKDKNWLETVRSVPDLLKGIDATNDNVAYRTFREGRIALENKLSIKTNVDGDEGCSLPIHLKVLPKQLEVYC